MKKRERGVSRLLKARQQLKNVAKELGIDLKEVFEDAAVLKRKLDAGRVAEAGLRRDTANVVDESPAGSNPAPSAQPETSNHVKTTLEVFPPGIFNEPATSVAVEQPTDIFNEPAASAEQPKEFGATGTRRAEPNPAVPQGTPYYIGRCRACNGEMLTRDNHLEDICETCAIVLRDDATEAQQKMIAQAGGQLVNPFREEDF